MAGPEAFIERTICREAKKAGYVVRKLTFPGARGAPDRIFGKDGVTHSIEFKRRGGVARIQQLRRMTELHDNFGWSCHICDTLDGARDVLGLPDG